jgi:hypothetical protein
MPLIKSKSKQAVGKNIKKEEEAGKPHNQAIAIALEVQRRAKARKMADGGTVPAPGSYAERFQKGFLGQKKADGGFIEPQPLPVMPNLDNPEEVKPEHPQVLSMILRSLTGKKKKK